MNTEDRSTGSRVHPRLLLGSVLHIILVFCVVLLCVFTFWIPCCDVRYDFRIKTMFDSPFPLVVCRRSHVYLRYLCLLAYSGVQHILCCVFVLFFVILCSLCCQFLCVFRHLVYPMLPVSLDCPFLIVPSVFSIVYFLTAYFYSCSLNKL